MMYNISFIIVVFHYTNFVSNKFNPRTQGHVLATKKLDFVNGWRIELENASNCISSLSMPSYLGLLLKNTFDPPTPD